MRTRAAETFSPAALAVALRSSSASAMTTFMSATSLSLETSEYSGMGVLGDGIRGVPAVAGERSRLPSFAAQINLRRRRGMVLEYRHRTRPAGGCTPDLDREAR